MKVFITPEADAKKVEVQLKSLHELNAKGIRAAFYKLGKNLKASANTAILKTPRSGRAYFIRRKGRIIRHVASVPGETPANLSGALRKSLDFNVQGADRMEFGYREAFPANPRSGVIPKGGVIYGKFLEEGTSKMSPRPGLLIAIKANQANAREHFETELRKQLTKKS